MQSWAKGTNNPCFLTYLKEMIGSTRLASPRDPHITVYPALQFYKHVLLDISYLFLVLGIQTEILMLVW